MSPLKAEYKVTLWGALIVGVCTIVASFVPGLFPPLYDSIHHPPKKYVNGVVFDSVTKAPMPGVVVKLQTNEGQPLTQDTTDRDGKFNLPIPETSNSVRLTASAEGYVSYDEKLITQDARNDVQLTRQPIGFGIPDSIQLGAAVRIVSGKLNVTVVFASGCGKKATTTALNGRELHGDPKIPETILKDLLTQVVDNSRRYDVITIEGGKRYEIRCF